MNKIDDILEGLKGQKPVISNPDELTDRIMDSLPAISETTEVKETRVVKMRWWMAIAASILIIIGIGLTILPFSSRTNDVDLLANQASPKPQTKQPTVQAEEIISTDSIYKKPVPKPVKCSPKAKTETVVDGQETLAGTQYTDPNLHYAVYTPVDDSTYQAPSRMDEFITKMADYNKVKGVPLMCAMDSSDSTAISTAYVFEDKQELNLFGRLLQAACWYDSKTPGYLLNFSHQQFFFTLKDLHKNEKYLWIAERIADGRILLFSSHSPIEANVSSVCYQNYREQLTHTNFSTLHF